MKKSRRFGYRNFVEREKLRHHKTQLIGFWRRNKIKIQAKIRAIKKSDDTETK